MRKFINLALFTFIGSSCHNGGNASLTGHFEGYFEYRNKKLYTAITFESSNNKLGACISVPANLLLNKPFTTVEYNAPVIQLKMKDGDLPVNIVATLAKNNIDGKLDGNIPASIHLTKVENYIEPAKAYTIKEIILDNNGTKLLSNLYLPKKQFPSGAIIMVAGSGNHTKEEYNGAADLFASRGIATLTFDKRNVTDALPERLRGSIRSATIVVALSGVAESSTAAAIRYVRDIEGRGVGDRLRSADSAASVNCVRS